ncbi:addiction module antidote protein, HigA family [Coraliomargarita sinensis]|uniref:Addiction module antidote protein, HigA family n=2 Tax=Coraliomargarita sinensis TaxID=2174842 RepID=A0A317ZPG7_9BACT|nr:addiction module antidote protein, HigA family [Coraliomargarita sinensis]
MLAATPGRILLEEFLEPMGLSQAELARRTGIPASRLTEIIKGRRAITAETALALGIFFNMEAQFWMNLQSHSDLRRAQMEKEIEFRKRIDPLPVAAVAENQVEYNS